MTEANVPPNAQPWVGDHVRRYLASNGADGHMFVTPAGFGPVPTLLLTTIGRRTGQKFVMPLIYGKSGGNYLVVGSKGGSPEHPGWYLNLTAHPEVEVQVVANRFRAMARTATGEERKRLWREMATLFPPYIEYQKMAAREIPVVVIEPLGA